LKTRKRIALVNITGTALVSYCDLLDLWGYTPVKIESAEMISADLSSEPPALLIFQFLEFSEDEYALLDAIYSKAPGILVLATSPFTSVRDIFKIARAGVADYLMQPFFPAALRQLIEKYLNPSVEAQANHGEAEDSTLEGKGLTIAKEGQSDSIDTDCGSPRSIHVDIGAQH